MSTCRCPDVPEITNPIPAGPIACSCCGSPLVITCANQCGDAAVTESFARAAAASPAQTTIATFAHPAPRKPMTFRPKLCACGVTFTPTGGRETRRPLCKATPNQPHEDSRNGSK